MSKEKRTFPPLNSDKDAERFIAEADLSEYNLSSFKPLSSYAFAKRKDTKHD